MSLTSPHPDRSATAPLDLAHLERQTFGRREFATEILTLFVGHAADIVARLEGSAEEGVWRMAGHTLKGAARGVGAIHVAAAAEVVERTQHPESKAGQEALAMLKGAVAEARVFIERELAS